MKKISLNNIIKFRNRVEKNQKSFLNSLIRKAEIKTDGGGNYWVRSLSALSNSVKLNDNDPIKDKIGEIVELFTPDLIKQTKDMYERNLHILHNYEDFDFSDWLPEGHEILSKTNKKSVIEINNVLVQITPSQIFSFEKGENKFIGAIWFVAKLEGYKTEELAMFTEALYIYLTMNFEENFIISEEHCIVADVLAKIDTNYKKIANNEISSPLTSTLDLIKSKL